MGPSRDEGFSIPRRNKRPGQAAAPPVVRGFGYRWHWVTRGRFPGVSTRLDGIRLAVGVRCLVGGVRRPTARDGALAGQRVRLRQRMRAASYCSARRCLLEVETVPRLIQPSMPFHSTSLKRRLSMRYLDTPSPVARSELLRSDFGKSCLRCGQDANNRARPCAPALWAVLVMLGASGQCTKMKTGEPIG
jgi:hypothetical protein